ncbi:hypothetical protein N8338_00530 [Amylibacter sp.]|nr:hypothetical protein [Amylibacter sp.]
MRAINMLAAAWTCRGVKFDGTAMLVAIIATASTASGVPGSALCNVSKASVTTAPTAAIGVTVARVASRVTIVDTVGGSGVSIITVPASVTPGTASASTSVYALNIIVGPSK